MKLLKTLATLVGLAAAGLVAASSSASGYQESIGITRAQADAILTELQQIRQLLEVQITQQGRPQAVAPQKRSMKLEGGFILGSPDALLTMVEFTDYQCPYCRQFEAQTFEQIKKTYIDTGKLRFTTRNFPLENHENAMRAAEGAMCAGDQGKFWPMRDLLFRRDNPLTPEAINASARDLQLQPDTFRTCLETDRHKADILRDQSDATTLGVNATPSFLIGRTTPYGVEGIIVAGAENFANFEKILKDLIR